MKQTQLYTALLFLLVSCRFFSQNINETRQWYFGIKAGLSFTSSPPTPITTSSMIAQEGSASIADAFGNLLFYTDGITVYDRQNQVMANGTGLLGKQTSGQVALILQKPGSQNLYYIFTTDELAGSNGLRYSIVDISLAAGMGSVTVKNIQLQTPTTEKLTAVKHCNGIDTWVLTHDWNSANFRCFLLTSAGVANAPVITSIGSVHNGGAYGPLGYLKVSPNGQRLGLAITGLDRYELFDFDNSTGVVSNSLVLISGTNKPYGCEFSPDSKKFYGASDENPGIDNLFQWDLSSGVNSTIIASKTTLSNTVRKGALQLAPDGKIYVARLLAQYDLGVINNPNVAGTGCNYIDVGQSLGGQATGWAGLPNFMSSYFNASGIDLGCSVNTGLQAFLLKNKIRLFPNPAADVLNVSFEDRDFNGVRSLVLFTMLDHEALSISSPEEQVQLKTQALAPGIYFLKVYENGTLIAAEKIVKE